MSMNRPRANARETLPSAGRCKLYVRTCSLCNILDMILCVDQAKLLYRGLARWYLDHPVCAVCSVECVEDLPDSPWVFGVVFITMYIVVVPVGDDKTLI